MNSRERFLAITKFRKPDMVPVSGGPRKATLERWYNEGLPRNADITAYFRFERIGGLTSYPSEGFVEWKWNLTSSHDVNIGPNPPFDYKILEKTERYWVWVDNLGIKQKGFREDWENGWSGFATRQFMEFPIKDRSSFLEIKRRYEPCTSDRYPKDWEKIVEELAKRDYPLCVTLRGQFLWTRDMMGLENMLLTMYKDPGLILDIMEFCAEFQTTVLEKALGEVDADWVELSEDLAYKKGPMISPKAFRDFMSKPYREICGFLKGHHVDVIVVDSDGNPELLIPIWMEVGVNGIVPCEIAANVDPVKLRNTYPRLILMGA
jgi:uroporphyrinogen decarboxylase